MAKKASGDMFAALVEAETNGDNYDIGTEDIVARLKEWQSFCTFTISDVDYNQLTLHFSALPKDLDSFIRDAIQFCPDLIVDDEDIEIPILKKQLKQSKKLGLWWD